MFLLSEMSSREQLGSGEPERDGGRGWREEVAPLGCDVCACVGLCVCRVWGVCRVHASVRVQSVGGCEMGRIHGKGVCILLVGWLFVLFRFVWGAGIVDHAVFSRSAGGVWRGFSLASGEHRVVVDVYERQKERRKQTVFTEGEFKFLRAPECVCVCGVVWCGDRKGRMKRERKVSRVWCVVCCFAFFFFSSFFRLRSGRGLACGSHNSLEQELLLM